MENYKTSNLLKIICYITIPFLIMLCISSTILMIIKVSEGEKEDYFTSSSYSDSKMFSQDYLNEVSYKVSEIKNQGKYDYSIENSLDSNGIYYLTNDYNHKLDTLIIDHDGNIYTNIDKTMQTDTPEKIISYIEGGNKYWIQENGEIKTNIQNLQKEKIMYTYPYERIGQSGYKIYTCMQQEYRGYEMLYDIARVISQYDIIFFLISIILVFIEIIYLIVSAGYKKGEEGIYLNWFDKIPSEILVVFCILIPCEMLAAAGCFSLAQYRVMVFLGIFISIITIETGILFFIDFIKRIKTKTLFKNTLIYKFWRCLKKHIKNVRDSFSGHFEITLKMAILYGLYLVVLIILMMLAVNFAFFILLLIGYVMYVFWKLIKKAEEQGKIYQSIQYIYQGKNTKKLNIEEFSGEFKTVAIQLNDIMNGFTNAVEEQMKSEKLKTELITNVSHDIKTPLTSIINYVDLLKKEKIENEKAREYLDVLDNKSQRLKKLIEDLIDASKASSGNIKLQMEEIDVKELMQQITGEFEDRFDERKLETIITIPENNVKIKADSKHIYRIFENLYINIYKYALEGSRVYIDVKEKDEKISIELKNISKEMLNISPEELMQRFVRGDSSRTTNGSGLGLSIAKSLTELQNGKFNIKLDGDLFKVVIILKRM